MPLSEDEQKILRQIEEQFYESDPDFAGELGRHSVYAHLIRRLKWAGFAFVAGVIGLVAALATESHFLFAFGGFVVMLAAALWFERSLRKLGRAGVEKLTSSMRASGLGDSVRGAGDRVRDRFRRDET